ncbi:hypothetical protein [Streptomyces sp. NBC_00829]|uniref:hypothetical protein n=1 Tax=Streptomyces sp. NBC_00829 TaxID=2903679 RepID=UPI00386DA19B|nr:hypothetical protein OG293_12305 [Streptomyces sp. NBC_00829]
MKYSRVAAIVAGSVVALGAASPAMAAPTAMAPMSLNGGLTDALGSAPLLNGNQNVVGEATRTATDLNNVRGDAPEAVLKTATGLTPMLEGVEFGG